MKKSKVFTRVQKGSNRFTTKITAADIHPSTDAPFVIPKEAKHIQIVCTAKKTADSFEWCEKHKGEPVLEIFASDFVDNKLPTKKKFYHIEWW